MGVATGLAAARAGQVVRWFITFRVDFDAALRVGVVLDAFVDLNDADWVGLAGWIGEDQAVGFFLGGVRQGGGVE